jgi:hypothetical protein
MIVLVVDFEIEAVREKMLVPDIREKSCFHH